MQQQPNFEIDDFIGYFPKSIDPNFCDFLCSYMDKAEQVQGRRYTHVKDKQICLDAFSPGEAKDLMNGVNGCLYYYVSEFSYLTNFNYVSAVVLMQKTAPTEGYHMFHAENLNYNNNIRTMAWMVYLNDVEEGGETEFPELDLTVTPKCGTMLLFPSTWTYLHRGNTPISNDKYILGSYLHYV